MGRGRRASIAFGEVAKLSNPTDNSTDGEHVQRPVAPAPPGRNFVRDLRRGSPAPGSPPSSPKDSRRGSVTPEYLRRGSIHPEPYGDLRRGPMAPIDPFQAFDMTARKIPVIRSGRQRTIYKMKLCVAKTPLWLWKALAEYLGTLIFLLGGLGVVASAVFGGAQEGLFQVVVVWGFSLTVSIVIVGPISGAHLNPALTLALVLFRRKGFPKPWRTLITYSIAQYLGAFSAGLINYAVWRFSLRDYEALNNITRGMPGSQASAMWGPCFFPNPVFSTNVEVYVPTALLVEVLGTACLVLVIFSLTDGKNKSYQESVMNSITPFYIGLSLCVEMSVFAALTMASFNPARDLGPRLAALCFGWGEIAFPGPRGGFWIYFVGAYIGALLGACVYLAFLGTFYQDGTKKHVIIYPEDERMQEEKLQ